jgi:hypothetical protein
LQAIYKGNHLIFSWRASAISYLLSFLGIATVVLAGLRHRFDLSTFDSSEIVYDVMLVIVFVLMALIIGGVQRFRPAAHAQVICLLSLPVICCTLPVSCL